MTYVNMLLLIQSKDRLFQLEMELDLVIPQTRSPRLSKLRKSDPRMVHVKYYRAVSIANAQIMQHPARLMLTSVNIVHPRRAKEPVVVRVIGDGAQTRLRAVLDWALNERTAANEVATPRECESKISGDACRFARDCKVKCILVGECCKDALF